MSTAGEELERAHQPEGAEAEPQAPASDGASTETTLELKEDATPAERTSESEESESEFDEFTLEHPEASLDEIEALRERQEKGEGEEPRPEGAEESQPGESVEDGQKYKIKYNGEEREYSLDALKNLAQQGLNFQQQHGDYKPLLDTARQHGFNSQETGQMVGLGAKVMGILDQAHRQGFEPGSPEWGATVAQGLGWQVRPRQQPTPQEQPQQQGDPDFVQFLDELSPGAKQYFAGLTQRIQQQEQQIGQLGGYVQNQTQAHQRAQAQKFAEAMVQGINAADEAMNKAEQEYGVKLDEPTRVEYANYARAVSKGNPSQLGDPNMMRSFLAYKFPDAFGRVAGKVVAAEEIQRRRDAAQAAASGPSAPAGAGGKPKHKSAWDEDVYTKMARKQGLIK